MEMETTLAASVEVTRNKADYDAACKRLLSEKIILAWILKHCLEEFREYDVREIAERFIEGQPQVSAIPVTPDETGSVIRGMGQENISPTEGSVFFDIYFYAVVPGVGETVQLIVNVEAQNKFYPGYPLLKRGVFYASRMISAQDGTVFTKSHYEKLRKVYSIWICTNPPQNRENTITQYQMTEKNLVGSVRENVQNYDLLSVIMICLGGPDREHYDGVLKLLGTLLSRSTSPDEKKRVLRDEFDIPMTQTIEKEVSLMCNLSDGVYAKGLEDGILQSLQNLMETMGLSVSDAMNALRVPEADREEYAAQLQKQE